MEHQAGIPTAELCRKHGISEATFYNRRSRYGGMQVSDARRLKSLEDEKRRLKKLLAESMLDVATLKTWAIEEKCYSQRRACGLVRLDPKTFRYASR